MAKVPEIDVEAEEQRMTTIYRQKLVEAMHTFRSVADAKTMQTVPLTRIVNPLDWKTKLLIASRKFVSGFTLGALGSLGTAVATGGLGALTGGGTLAAAGIYGILGGLGLTGAKYVKETRKDKKLDKEVRNPEKARAEGYNDASLDWLARIISIVMNIAEAAGLNTQEALRYVYTALEIAHELPYEVGEFLLTLSTVVEDGTARGGFTGAEIQAVLKEAKDVKAAALRLHELWDER